MSGQNKLDSCSSPCGQLMVAAVVVASSSTAWCRCSKAKTTIWQYVSLSEECSVRSGKASPAYSHRNGSRSLGEKRRSASFASERADVLSASTQAVQISAGLQGTELSAQIAPQSSSFDMTCRQCQALTHQGFCLLLSPPSVSSKIFVIVVIVIKIDLVHASTHKRPGRSTLKFSSGSRARVRRKW